MNFSRHQSLFSEERVYDSLRESDPGAHQTFSYGQRSLCSRYRTWAHVCSWRTSLVHRARCTHVLMISPTGTVRDVLPSHCTQRACSAGRARPVVTQEQVTGWDEGSAVTQPVPAYKARDRITRLPEVCPNLQAKRPASSIHLEGNGMEADIPGAVPRVPVRRPDQARRLQRELHGGPPGGVRPETR